MNVSFIDATTGAKFEMLSINSQTLINTKRDRTAPDIVLFGEYGGSYAYGSKVTLPSAAAGDVLDPNVRFTLSVTDPDGKPCVATDGTEITGVAPVGLKLNFPRRARTAWCTKPRIRSAAERLPLRF